MDDSTLQTILENTYTKSDFYRSIDVVQEYLEKILFNTIEGDERNASENISILANEKGDNDIAERINKWGDKVLSTFTQENFYDRLSELKKRIESLPELVLYVPVSFGPKEVSMIGEWCRKNIDMHILLSMSVDPAVTGGCAFVWKGKLYNFSLDYFLKKSGEDISRIIHSYDAR